MFRKIFTAGLILLTLFAFGMDMILNPEPALARKVTYYLSRWGSTSTKIFTLPGAASETLVDTTVKFTPRENMIFFVHVEQANDSVGVKYIYWGAQKNIADSTHAVVAMDSGVVFIPGVSVFKWTHFVPGADSGLMICPSTDYGFITLSDLPGGGEDAKLNIRYMGAEGVDW